jgi:hypothetical protein
MFNSRRQLRRWAAGDPIRQRYLNEAVDVLQRVLEVLGINIDEEGDVSELGDAYSPLRLGKVVSAGPAGEADFNDPRYWVRELDVRNGAGNRAKVEVDNRPDEVFADQIDPDTGDPVAGPTIVPIRVVTNVPEILNDTHTIPVGTVVLYLSFYDRKLPTPNERNLMAVGGTLPKGQYKGQLFGNVTDNQTGFDFPRAHGTLANPF